MKYAETGFRALYRHFAVFPLTDVTASAVAPVGNAESADGVLVYGYIDHDTGLTLEVIAPAQRNGEFWRFTDGNDEIRSMIRFEAVEKEEFNLMDDSDGRLNRRYAKKLEMLKVYDASEEIEKSRQMDFLDGSRHPYHVDDVLVFLEREGVNPEGCWARIIDVTDHRIWAKLLNEPNQDFGIHRGEDFTFYVHKNEKTGKVTCHARFSPVQKMKQEDFEDGSLLKDAIRRFHKENDKDTLFWILQILRDSYVWIPCDAVVGDKDQKAVMEMIEEAGDDPDSMIGKEFTSQENIRFVPDVLQKDGKYFLPAFSTEEDMGEYGERFSKIQEHFLQVIDLARKNKKYKEGLTGIVINAFSEPFILPKELYDAVEKMVSRVE